MKCSREAAPVNASAFVDDNVSELFAKFVQPLNIKKVKGFIHFNFGFCAAPLPIPGAAVNSFPLESTWSAVVNAWLFVTAPALVFDWSYEERAMVNKLKVQYGTPDPAKMAEL